MNDQPSFQKLVTQVLSGAPRPLTVDEIQARVEMIRPVDTRNPHNTLRGAIQNLAPAVTLGGRPAHYTWWPRHLVDNTFRQSLALLDLEAGTLALSEEVWLALWPDETLGPWRESTVVTLVLEDGPETSTRVAHFMTDTVSWGLEITPDLAQWHDRSGATLADEWIVRVLDLEERRYGVRLVGRTERENAGMAAAIAARNQSLADAAERVVRTGRGPVPHFELVPRLIAHNVYRCPLPPDPWDDVLRADLRFVIDTSSAALVERMVEELEREYNPPPHVLGPTRPPGTRRKARSDEARQAWADYLFDQGMEYLWAGWDGEAEACYKEAVRIDPGHAAAWVHVGNRRFEEERVAAAMALYEKGQAAAEKRTIGDAERYPGPFWSDERTRPYMRALHGRGLCLWRLGRVDDARRIFARMLELNPNDNQGVRFLLRDIDEELNWEESTQRDNKRFP